MATTAKIHRWLASLPVRRALPALVFLAGAASMPAATALDEEDCAADRDAMLAAIAANRARAISQTEAAMGDAGSEEERELLRSQVDELWDREESERALAHRAFRDCVTYVRGARERAD